MVALPSALAIHASRPSRRDLPFDWTAKSMIVVVPPKAAARVPVSNVSLANVPPKGSSMWVWTSIAPGITYLPPHRWSRPRSTVEIGADEGDALAVDEHVGARRRIGVDDGSTGDERPHRSSVFLRFREAPILASPRGGGRL